jgi:pimeloyl-ACP methyl ester carboxylesterase
MFDGRLNQANHSVFRVLVAQSALLLAVFMGTALGWASQSSAPACELGAYRSSSGELATLTSTPRGVRYTLLDGRRGTITDSGAALTCRNGALEGDGKPWNKLHFKSTPVDFGSHGVRLHGVLLEPTSTASKPPLIVMVHGSERTSPIGSSMQQLLTAQGTITFVYDKRGTGRSGGTYTQDFYVLADDAAAAAEAARNRAAGKYKRLGFYGGSQGGWVAPLAALKASADFLEVGFGVVGTPLEQDQWQVDYQLEQLGFPLSPGVHDVTSATAKVAESNFAANLRELQDVRRKYRAESWYRYLDGQYTGEVVRGELTRARDESPQVPWHYDSIGVLEKLTIPQLWIFAGDDSVAPSANSIRRLQTLRTTHRNITIFVFPKTDHGITTYVTQAPGHRQNTGLANGFLELTADWAKGDIHPPYGTSKMISRASVSPKY